MSDQELSERAAAVRDELAEAFIKAMTKLQDGGAAAFFGHNFADK